MSIPMNSDTADLFEEIEKISKRAAKILREKYPNEEELLNNLTMKDLKKLYPVKGTGSYNKQKEIMSLIDRFKQARSVGDEPRTETSKQSVSGRLRPPKRKKSAKVHVLVAGETFGTHDTFMKKLKLKLKEIPTQKDCRVILLFCPVVSGIGTDMEAAMARVTEDNPVILVFMHHCHNPSHITNTTVQPCRSNIVQVVHCAFHESKGLLDCQENEQAVSAVGSTLLRYVDSHAEVPQSSTRSDTEQQPKAALDDNGANITPDSEPQSTEPVGERSDSHPCKDVTKMEDSGGSSGVKVHVLVAGETFCSHERFMKKLKLKLKEIPTQKDCKVILLFCPVASRIGTDMETAMARVTGDKPVVLVFMHHCHSPSQMINITVQPCRSNIVKTVHCAFLETNGLLQCEENKQAIEAVRLELKKYKKETK